MNFCVLWHINFVAAKESFGKNETLILPEQSKEMEKRKVPRSPFFPASQVSPHLLLLPLQPPGRAGWLCPPRCREPAGGRSSRLTHL